MSTTQTPQQRSASGRSAMAMPLKTALSRTCDRPMKASGPQKSRPRVKPGSTASASYFPVAGSTQPKPPLPDSSTHSRPSYQRGECGIDRPRGDDFSRSHVQEDAAALLVGPPAAGRVGRAQGGDEGRAAVRQAQAVEVAAVLRGQRRDERRPPARHEAVGVAPRAQAGEARVDEPQLGVVPAGIGPGHLVDLDVAGADRRARQEAGVVAAGRLQAAGHGRGVVVFPDLHARADGQPIPVHGQAHRLAEAAEVRVEALAVGAEHHQLAGLVGGDQHGDAEFLQDRGEVAGVDAAQRRWVVRCWEWPGSASRTSRSLRAATISLHPRPPGREELWVKRRHLTFRRRRQMSSPVCAELKVKRTASRTVAARTQRTLVVAIPENGGEEGACSRHEII